MPHEKQKVSQEVEEQKVEIHIADEDSDSVEDSFIIDAPDVD